MPTSRNRRPRHESPRAHTDRLAPWFGHILRVDAAERRGDVARALELIEEMPHGPDGRPFWRPWRVERLVQLQVLGASLPSWVYSRWLLEQALQHHDARNVDISRRARDTAVRVRGGREALRRAYPVDPDTKVIDHDWVYRQTHLYELGGLTTFLRAGASPDLIRRARHVRTWARAPMGGFRLVHRRSATTTFEDLADWQEIVTPNIGSAGLLIPGEHVIGRLVPTTSGRMFETVPLQVPEGLARSVAHDPPSWPDLLEHAMRQEPISVHVHRFGFVSDLPATVAAEAIRDWDDQSPAALARTFVRTAELAVTDGLDWGDEDVDAWACLGALAQSPTILHALALESADTDAEVLARLATRLAEPASSVCRDAADGLRRVA